MAWLAIVVTTLATSAIEQCRAVADDTTRNSHGLQASERIGSERDLMARGWRRGQWRVAGHVAKLSVSKTRELTDNSR